MKIEIEALSSKKAMDPETFVPYLTVTLKIPLEQIVDARAVLDKDEMHRALGEALDAAIQS